VLAPATNLPPAGRPSPIIPDVYVSVSGLLCVAPESSLPSPFGSRRGSSCSAKFYSSQSVLSYPPVKAGEPSKRRLKSSRHFPGLLAAYTRCPDFPATHFLVLRRLPPLFFDATLCLFMEFALGFPVPQQETSCLKPSVTRTSPS